MTFLNRLNNHHVCFMCGRRADGMAVGNPDRLGWYCNECGLERAKEAIRMPKDMDVFEQRALQKVAASLPADQFNFPASELPQFIKWVIDDFGEAIRKEVDGGKAPF